MPAPLENFLHLMSKSGGTVTDETYKQYGGDDILASIQKYDPDAKWVETESGGGDAGGTGKVKQLQYDLSKLPQSKMGDPNLDLRPGNWNKINNDYVIDDDVYGNVTNSKNIKVDNSGLHKWAPLIGAAMTMAIPGMNAALLGAGLGSAGLTSAVTAGAAGLGAGSTVGALGGMAASQAPSWLASLGNKIPTIGRTISGGGNGLSWESLLGSAAGMTGIPGASFAPALLALLGQLNRKK